MRTVYYFLNNPRVHVTPKKNDQFSEAFFGMVLWSQYGKLTVLDRNTNKYFEVEVDQVLQIPYIDPK